MFQRNKHLKMILAILALILILAYAFVVFLPHSHECVEVDCVVCTLIKSSRNILFGIALSASFYQLTSISFIIFDTPFDISSARENTPVGLKVKLSD